MPLYITILDFPKLSDRHESKRDLQALTHTHARLRQYRDYLCAIRGPSYGYDHMMCTFISASKQYFHETFRAPYHRLLEQLYDVAHEGFSEAVFIALAGRDDNALIRERENTLLQELTGGVGNLRQSLFPAGWDALQRMRYLYAMRAAEIAQETLPVIPEAAEILSREFLGDIVLPRIPAKLDRQDRSEIRRIASEYQPEDAYHMIRELLPPMPAWTDGTALDDICQAIIRTFHEQMEDDEFIDRWLEPLYPELGKHGEPSEENMRRIEETLSDAELSPSHLYRHYYPSLLEWIAEAEACGHPIDERVLKRSGYPGP